MVKRKTTTQKYNKKKTNKTKYLKVKGGNGAAAAAASPHSSGIKRSSALSSSSSKKMRSSAAAAATPAAAATAATPAAAAATPAAAAAAAAAAASPPSSGIKGTIKSISFGKPYTTQSGRSAPKTITELLKNGPISDFKQEFEFLINLNNRQNIDNYVQTLITNSNPSHKNREKFNEYVLETYKINLDDSITKKIIDQSNKPSISKGKIDDITEYVYKSFLYALNIFTNNIKIIIDDPNNQGKTFYLYDNANCNIFKVDKLIKGVVIDPNAINFIFCNKLTGKNINVTQLTLIDNKTHIFNLKCIMTCEADDFALVLTYGYLSNMKKPVTIYSNDQFGWYRGFADGAKRRDHQNC